MKKMARWFYILMLLPLMAMALGDMTGTELILSGNVIARTCEVSASSLDQTVQMGTWDTRYITSNNSMSDPVAFNIDFTNCGSSATSVDIAFHGDTDPENPSYLKLDGSAGANADIRLLDQNDQVVVVNPADNGYNYPLVAGQDNELTFRAQYVWTTLPVTPGPADATATFELVWP